MNSTFFDPTPADGATYVRTWEEGRALLSGCQFAATPELQLTPFAALNDATIYSNDRSIKIRRGSAEGDPVRVVEPTPVSEIPDFPDDSNMAFVWRSDVWFVRTQKVRNRLCSAVRGCAFYPLYIFSS